MDLAAIRANAALPKGVIIRWHRLHACNRRCAISLGGRHAHIGDRLQVMQRAGIGAGMGAGEARIADLRANALR